MREQTSSPPRRETGKRPAAATKVVRNATTGRAVTVKGYGALRHDSPAIEEGVDLLKPIAGQAIGEGLGKRKTA